MEQDIKLVDLVIELLDARIPMASRNPDIDKLAKGKLRLVLLNKADMADDVLSRSWKRWFEEQGIPVVMIDSRSGKGKKEIQTTISTVCAEKMERDRKRGIRNRPVRAMVVGIPNVGKSTFINTFAGKAVAKTGNKPGVTRGNQWIRLNKDVELLDTPGILWPKLGDEATGLHLAMVGSVNDEILDTEELAANLLMKLSQEYPVLLENRFGAFEGATGYERLEEVAQKRGCLLAGGRLDTRKAAKLILDDFRGGRIGKMTLEKPV